MVDAGKTTLIVSYYEKSGAQALCKEEAGRTEEMQRLLK